jgi:hypothetical protein
MSEQNSGFGKFIPGFDFLQNLAKGASQSVPQMPNLSNWIAPTLNLEELDKRIGELKAVRFWLEQNSVALAATIQALEVQKMTLATLKGMNFNMGEVADALKLKTPPDLPATVARPEPANAAPTGAPAADQPEPARQKRKGKDEPAVPVVDPLQWWGALTQQFQQIATNAMQDAAAAAASAPAAGGGAAAPATGGTARRGSATGAGSVRKKAAPAKRSTRKAAAR